MSRNTRKKSGGGWLSVAHRMLSVLVLGGNVVVLLMLWGVCASTQVSAAEHGHLAVLGLGFPIVMLLNVLFLVIWAVVNWRGMLLPILGIALVWNFVLDYCPMGSSREAADSASTLRIVTWNTHGFSQGDADTDSLLSHIGEWKADLLVFQEIYGAKTTKMLDSLATEMEYVKVTDNNGRMVLSRFPLIRQWVPETESSFSNGAFAMDLQYGEDTLTLVSCHLESNFIDAKDRADGREVLTNYERDAMMRQGEFMWGKLAKAARMRGAQVDVLTALIDSLPAGRPVVVCGDFNDTPISYAYQQMNQRLKSAWRQAGRGIGVSYNEPYFLFRIDHLFHSDYWQAIGASIEPNSIYSDHNPLIVDLERKTVENTVEN